MTLFHVMPYVPGLARGVLRRGLGAAAPDAILALSQAELRALPAPAAGLIVVDGAPFSHAMLRLLGMGIPAVMASTVEFAALPEGTEVVMDGERGTIAWGAEADHAAQPISSPAPIAGRAVETTDGVAVELRASVTEAAGAARAAARGAAAVGLVRSEFLWPEDGRLPDADYYEQALGALCESARPLSVTVRLLDVAADKRPPWLKGVDGIEGPLGRHGARLYATEPVRRVLDAQLRAIARLAARYDLRVLVPNVANVEEAGRLREALARVLPAGVPIGMMAETPAAALGLAEWDTVADFTALGCNDLMQCLFGADRDDPLLSAYLDPCAPALYRFLHAVAARAGVRRAAVVQVCGLLPQLPGMLPVFLGLGFRVFSVEPTLVPYLARIVGETETARATALAARVCEAASASEVRTLLGLAPCA